MNNLFALPFSPRGFVPARAILLASSLLLGVALGGCSFFKGDADAPVDLAEAREHEKLLVTDTIDDADRSEAFLLLLSERNELLDEQTIVTREHIEQIEALTKNYHSTRAEFAAQFDRYNAARTVGQRRYVEIAGAMKNATTGEEWKVIGKYQLKYLDARAAVYINKGEVQ